MILKTKGSSVAQKNRNLQRDPAAVTSSRFPLQDFCPSKSDQGQFGGQSFERAGASVCQVLQQPHLLMQQKATRRKRSAKLRPEPSNEKAAGEQQNNDN